MTPVVAILLAAVGAAWGFGADRLSVRWPEHEEDYRPRGLDWRTAVLVVAGAAVFGELALRWVDPVSLAILLGFAAALLVLLATDLDQRILPDLITVPLIPIAAALLLTGSNPLLAGKEFALVSGIGAAVGTPIFLFVTDRLLRGALGAGDLKLAVSIGLLAGVSRLFAGFLLASICFAAVLLLLIAVRRLGLRTAVPFGPVLIGATFLAMILR